MTNEQLVELIQQGQDTSANMLMLWQQNQGLITKIALKYSGYEDIDDLKQQGYIGLCEAVKAYRQEEGVLFASYAVFWLKHSMRRYIEECGSVVRIPTNTRGLMIKYKQLITAMMVNYGRKPTQNEIMLYLGVDEERMRQLSRGLMIEQMKSINVPVGDDEGCMLYELIQSNTDLEGEVLDNIQLEQLKELLWGLVSRLPNKEPDIIMQIYQNGRTRKEAGSLTDTDVQRVRCLEIDALKRLRCCKGSSRLKTFLPEYDGIIASKAMQGTGAKSFKYTWTSATERVAINEL